jgi:hypothetical protein
MAASVLGEDKERDYRKSFLYQYRASQPYPFCSGGHWKAWPIRKEVYRKSLQV